MPLRERREQMGGKIPRLREEIPRNNHGISEVFNIPLQETGRCINSAVTRFADDLPGTN